MRPVAFLVLAALALTPSAASLQECSELHVVETMPVPGAGGPATFGVPGCAMEARPLVTSNVLVRWAHDEAGITGLTVVLEGEGVDPTPMPMTEGRYLDGADGLREKSHYKSPVVHFASGHGGELTATLYRDGVPIAVARAVAVV